MEEYPVFVNGALQIVEGASTAQSVGGMGTNHGQLSVGFLIGLWVVVGFILVVFQHGPVFVKV